MNPKLFERWFEALVKNKMAGAALPIAGMSMGYVIIQGSRFVPEGYVSVVGILGLALMTSSVGVFIVVMVGFAWLWLSQPAQGRRR